MAEPVVSFEDVTAIMGLAADMRDDIREIRRLLEEFGGEEEEDPEADG